MHAPLAPSCPLRPHFALQHAWFTALCGAALLLPRTHAAAPLWEAFNDHRPTDGVTSPNATGYDLRITDDGGVLKNIVTGADLPVSVQVVVEGDGTPDDFGANSPVNAGSPADLLFQGKVDIGNSGIPGVRASTATRLVINFNGLNPNRRYNFRGTSSRGGNYNDRWSLFSLEGTVAFANAHVDGSNNKNIFTKSTHPASDLTANQVALNTGDNKAGSLVGWDNIEPGSDGTFSIAAQQYTGVAPFGNPSAAAYAYGFSAIYLAEVESTGSLRITGSPANQVVAAGATATFTVTAESPQAIAYQWQLAAAGGTNFTDVAGATLATYTTRVLTVADDGGKVRCRITSGTAEGLSGEATLHVDGVIPALLSATGSTLFNSIYLKFSEALKLDQLALKDNYSLGGGLSVTSVVVLDPVSVRLITDRQTAGTRYTVSVANIEDLAGNKLPAGSSASFNAFTLQSGFVGVEIWKNVSGGNVSDLRASPRYPAEPDLDFATTTFNSELVVPNGPDNIYGGRLRAWLTPETSGDYEFFLRGDDTAELRVSADDLFDTLDNLELEATATDASAGDTFQESGVDASTSQPITLVKGRRYAIQALWKESNGNDYCQVAWRKVGDSTPADQLTPIPSALLSYYGPPPAPTVEPRITRVAIEAGRIVVGWTGGALQTSTDLKTWTEVAGATNPHNAAAGDAARFFRARD